MHYYNEHDPRAAAWLRQLIEDGHLPEGTVMRGALSMSAQKSSTDTSSVTFSQALEAGLSHYGWLVGPTTDLSGQDRALASHSVSLEKAKELQTRGIYGQLFAGFSPSADLQSSLESRLRAALDLDGSEEFSLTWKLWDMLQQAPICALRASGRRTSVNVSGGWATPTSKDSSDRQYQLQPITKKKTLTLPGQAMGSWPTPAARDHKSEIPPEEWQREGQGHPLSRTALGAWPTPTADDANNTSRESGQYQSLTRAAGWATPDASLMNDGASLEKHQARQEREKDKAYNGNGGGMPIGVQVQLAGVQPVVGVPRRKGPKDTD